MAKPTPQALADQMLEAVRAYVRNAVDALRPRLVEIEESVKKFPTVGPKGDKGDVGPQGLQGDIGEQGLRGEKGDKGDQGVRGPIGSPGLKGDGGSAGPKGEKGEIGEKGERGEKGEPGERGATGSQGESGPQGLIGEKGGQGDIGSIGPMGEIGPQGEAGPQGERGTEGPAGKDGVGLIGPKGDAGLPGKDGRDGIDGHHGLHGKDGTSVHPDTIKLMIADEVRKAVAELAPAKDGRDGAAGAAGRDALQIDVLPGLDSTKVYLRNTFAKHRNGLVRATRETDALDTVGGSLLKAGWEVIMNGIVELIPEMLPDHRTLSMKTVYTDGREGVWSSKLPVILNRGVWREGQYEQGDVVTWDGSSWHCSVEQTVSRPGNGSSDWKMMVKRGQDRTQRSVERENARATPVRLK